MAATAEYSNIVDLKVLQGLIGTDYTYKSALFNLGVLQIDNRPLPTGTQMVNVRGKLFQGDESGQSVGFKTPFSFKENVQSQLVAPIVVAGDGALISEIEEEVQAGGPMDPGELAAQINEKAGQMLDTFGMRVLEGCAAANTGNQTGSGATVTLDLINDARWVRDDYAPGFQNGVFLCRSEIAQKIHSLGLTAATSNTWGISGANIALQGTIPLLQGMTLAVSDKLTAVDSNDSYAYLLEKNSIVFRGGVSPKVKISDWEDGVGYKVKFWVRFAFAVRGMSWTGAGSDVYTEAELASSANWELKLPQAKHVPVSRMYTGIA